MRVPDGLRIEPEEESATRTQEWRHTGKSTPRPPPGVVWTSHAATVLLVFGVLLVIGGLAIPIRYLCNDGTYTSGNQTIFYDGMCSAPNPAIFLGIATIAISQWMRRASRRRGGEL